NPKAGVLAVGAGLGAACYAFQSLPTGIMERNFRYAPVGLVEIADVLVFNLTGVILGFFIPPLLALAAALALRGMIPAILAWFVSGIRVLPEWNGIQFHKAFQLAYPLVLTEGIVWIIAMAPGLIVVKLASANAYGVSQTAMSLLAFTLVLPTILQRLGVSWFSKIRNHSEEMRGQMETILRLCLVFYTPLILFFAALSPIWVPAVYGPKWPTLPPVLFWAALPTLVTAILMPFSSVFISAGKTKVVMLQNAVHAVLFIAALLLLSPHWGIYALPLSQLLAHSAGLVYLFSFRRYFGNFIQLDALLSGFVFLSCAITTHFLVRKGYHIPAVSVAGLSFLIAFMLNKKNLLLLQKLLHRLRHG
ncbi:MAG: oligosaccharide flippase family protein, partial [Spirochaetia bacterium]|nr:oligosaccharide flippase family protein [Spirochaetia bacterium]